MKEIIKPQAAIGSITPQLEGSSQSISHPERIPAQPKKGGAKYE